MGGGKRSEIFVCTRKEEIVNRKLISSFSHCLRPSIERSRIVRAVPYIDKTISGSWKPTALLLIALLLAIRIDHTSERKSAILFHIMAAIPGMGIHYQMSRHKKRDMPERQDTGTLREKGLDLAR
ncbi:unnamed protein product [Sphenostylis stenocarpa]|uniref:Uncharacterized protein n=1 Tax=Sphenostylis stenocarpa TaxID=92480 RepID=A0AA86SXM5_9FABA|nr:unnamed protein product [Sphenostylis stenocarpa]CAJ1969870.1 unnamed protein product [Sphenostylis stenocarpa]